jgi:hypothetical protein
LISIVFDESSSKRTKYNPLCRYDILTCEVLFTVLLYTSLPVMSIIEISTVTSPTYSTVNIPSVGFGYILTEFAATSSTSVTTIETTFEGLDSPAAYRAVT